MEESFAGRGLECSRIRVRAAGADDWREPTPEGVGADDPDRSLGGSLGEWVTHLSLDLDSVLSGTSTIRTEFIMHRSERAWRGGGCAETREHARASH